MSQPDQTHYRTVAKALVRGQVVPLLGAGANLCGRPEGATWQLGRYLPSGTELAAYLASSFEYPPDQARDLSRVSQYVAVMAGSGPLYEELHQLFNADYPASELHELLAGLPALAREQPVPRQQLIVTTNYDDALERAFRDKGEEFDLVRYAADGEHRGRFLHFTPAGEMHVVDRPNQYTRLSPDRRTVILKMHGAVDRANAELDSFVITEDHYIDYLARTDISSLLPIALGVRLQRSHFLFLGYSMRDWNLRVILHRIWGAQALTWASWAIQRDVEPIEEKLWRRRGVEILHASLEQYVAELRRHLMKQPNGRR